MANPILNDPASTKQFFRFNEVADELTMALEKVSALVEVLAKTEFEPSERLLQHNYIWALSDSVEVAQKLVTQIRIDS